MTATRSALTPTARAAANRPTVAAAVRRRPPTPTSPQINCPPPAPQDARRANVYWDTLRMTEVRVWCEGSLVGLASGHGTWREGDRLVYEDEFWELVERCQPLRAVAPLVAALQSLPAVRI